MIGSVLEYVIQMLPRTRLLLREVFMRLFRIMDIEDKPLDIEISEDLREGIV